MIRKLFIAAPVCALAACAQAPQGPSPPLYYCEYGIQFTARFVDDTVVLDGTRGYDVLYRETSGKTPNAAVYGNARMRAEFGLGASGREALLRYPLLPLVARCARD